MYHRTYTCAAVWPVFIERDTIPSPSAHPGWSDNDHMTTRKIDKAHALIVPS